MEDIELHQIIQAWSGTYLRLSMHELSAFTRRAGLSLVQMNVLMHLYYRGPSEVMVLCEAMQLSAAGASQLVERMVRQKLVTRVEQPNDRRVRVVHITEQGNQVVQDSIAARQGWMESMIEKLDGEEKELVGSALRLLTEHAITYTK